MLFGAFSRKEENRILDGFGSVLLGAVATSIDALTVGVSLSISGVAADVMALDASAILLFTFLTVVLGALLGQAAGKRFGRAAQFAGGLVLFIFCLIGAFDYICGT